MKALNILIVIWISTLFMGCANHPLNVQSNPSGAEISAVALDGHIEKLGVTPLALNRQDHGQLFKQSVSLRATKTGFTPQSVLLPPLNSLNQQAKVDFDLTETQLPEICTDQEKSLNELAQGVAQATSLIQSKKYVEATSLIQSLTVKFNSVSVLFDLQGNSYFLQKDIPRALAAYRRSHDLNPANSQTNRMIERLSQMQGSSVAGGAQ